MKRSTVFLSFLAVLGLAACATIIHGTRQSVGITSTPSAATVYDNGQLLGKTPMVAELSRKSDHRIRIELDGFAPYEIVLTRHVSGWLFGNLIFGGLIGIIVDAADGAIYNLKPEAITASLAKNADLSRPSSGLVIAVALHPENHGAKIGQMHKLAGPELAQKQGAAR